MKAFLDGAAIVVLVVGLLYLVSFLIAQMMNPLGKDKWPWQ